jgi:hypothetical protein
MATLIKNNTFFTADFAGLTASRKIEELMTMLTRIAYNNDADTEAYNRAMSALDEMRQIVVK